MKPCGTGPDTLSLVLPSAAHREAALEYRKEHFDAGERALHGSALWDRIEAYAEWFALLRGNASSMAREGWVPATTFFGVRESDGRIVGMIDIRHELNDFLANYGGHIGYGVRPSERRKGYAVRMLEAALEYAGGLGLERVMLSCDEENRGSRRTIEKCGGVLERQFVHTDGSRVRVYWISGLCGA